MQEQQTSVFPSVERCTTFVYDSFNLTSLRIHGPWASTAALVDKVINTMRENLSDDSNTRARFGPKSPQAERIRFNTLTGRQGSKLGIQSNTKQIQKGKIKSQKVYSSDNSKQTGETLQNHEDKHEEQAEQEARRQEASKTGKTRNEHG